MTKVYGVDRLMIYDALNIINNKYDNNIIFKQEPTNISQRNRGYNFSLRVKNSSEIGAGKTRLGHRSVSACWHVHGDFYDELFDSGAKRITTSFFHNIDMRSKEDNWRDYNTGSEWFPSYASGRCEC